MIRVCGSLLLLAVLLAPASHAQSAGTSTQNGTGAVDPTQAQVPQVTQPANKPEHAHLRVEAGVFYSPFVPGSGSQNWRGGDLRLTYTGIKRITPFGGLGRISNSYGSQFSYGIGSYFTVNRYFYLIGGMSASQDTEIKFTPHRRYDLTGFVSVPRVKGMAVSVGWTEMTAYGASGGGRIIAIGDLYYWRKFVFSGSVNLNYARPGNASSVSGQFSTMYGMQGHYYLVGGMSGGGAAYMMVTGAPFLVQYQTLGAFTMFTKWFARHAGTTFRYDYQDIVDSNAQRHSFRIGFFYEF